MRKLALSMMFLLAACQTAPQSASNLQGGAGDPPTAIGPCTDQDAQEVKKRVTTKYPEGGVSSVQCGPMDGLYEVVAGKNVFYIDKSVTKMAFAKFYDLTTQQEIQTAASEISREDDKPAVAPRSKNVQRADWSQFPQQHAVVTGKGRKHKVAIFTDVTCPYCARLHAALKTMSDVEVHEYASPVLGNSLKPTIGALCSRDKAAGLDLAYAGSEGNPAPGCDASEAIGAVQGYMKKMGWSAVPVIVRADGQVMKGFPSPEHLRKFMEGSL